MKTKYTRRELLDICEESFVNKKYWSDRDTSSSMLQIGQLYALLNCGCRFTVLTERSLKTDDRSIWVEVSFTNFSGFENDVEDNEIDTFYLPTKKRLAAVNGKDWY